MAEKGAYLAIENTVEQLEQAPATVQEIHKLTSLKEGLRTMSMLVKEFDGQEHEKEVVHWLDNVEEIAYETRDVISSIVEENNYYQKKRSKLKRLLSGGKQSKHVEEIQNIEERIEKARSFKDVDGTDQESHHSYTSVSCNADKVVGFDDAQEKLVTQIIGNTRQLEAILVFGMLGSGKTTLAKMVYNDERIKEHFYLKWVSFPQELSLEVLKAELKGNKYLIVIDNMHKHNSDVLNELMSCFPDESMGSRLLLTSRVPEADLHMQQRFSFSYEIKPLDENHSWLLLSRWVFEGKNNPDLESLGKRMACKCKGSPRAILGLAAIMNSADKTEEMWSKFLDGPDDLSRYYTLPEKLQDCLLYFGLFPAGSHISAKQIIQMWIAERLVEQQGSNTAEKIGESYLNELISNSFIEVSKRRANGSVKECYTFSYVHHLCKYKAISLWKAIPSKSLANHLIKAEEYSRAASFHCFSEKESPTPIHSVEFRKILLRKFHHLRILNLGAEVKLKKMPKQLGKLTALRYLKLAAPNLRYLPPSVVNLDKLETIDMRDSPLVSLPEGIWKLKGLRNLYLGGPTSLPKTSGIDYYRSLPNLQILSGVTPNKDLKWLVVRAKFPYVTKLRICSTCRELSFKFLNSLDHLYHLQSLRIEKPTKLPDQNAFPLSLTKLTLFETELDPECIKTLEILPNLRILQLLTKAICGENIECSAGGFSQLEVLCIKDLNVQKLTAERAMQCVNRCIIKGCDNLEISYDLKQVAKYLKDQEEIHDYFN